jgi:glycosyltransferase involved in cell wall biosynthesis
MVQDVQSSNQAPLFSIIVAVYNNWAMLGGCLQSLVLQTNGPSFEVIIVDDGSTETAPDSIRSSTKCYPFTLIRQSHAGISAARNRGIRTSKGSVLLFVDSDCRLQTNCLAALGSTIAHSPQHDFFQLRLVGDRSNLVGRAEELRLATFQNHTLQPDGRIRYLSTAGFAIRRTRADIETGVFDPVALRGEDTLLLANLMQAGQLPLFVHEAIVEHCVPLSLMGCFRKDIRSVYLEARAYDTIASKGVRIRVTQRERLILLWSTWKAAGQRSIGRSAWFVLVARQAFRRMMSLGYRLLGVRPVINPTPPHVDPEKHNRKR